MFLSFALGLKLAYSSLEFSENSSFRNVSPTIKPSISRTYPTSVSYVPYYVNNVLEDPPIKCPFIPVPKYEQSNPVNSSWHLISRGGEEKLDPETQEAIQTIAETLDVIAQIYNFHEQIVIKVGAIGGRVYWLIDYSAEITRSLFKCRIFVEGFVTPSSRLLTPVKMRPTFNPGVFQNPGPRQPDRFQLEMAKKPKKAEVLKLFNSPATSTQKEIVSRIGEHSGLLRLAQDTLKDPTMQPVLEKLFTAAAEGNVQVGRGDRYVPGTDGVWEMRAPGKQRAYFREENGIIQSVAISNKDNQDSAIDFLREQYPRKS